MTTKQLLESTGISEPTLRRWLRDGKPVPELLECKQDWRGWRDWEQRHVDAIRKYQEQKLRQHQGRNAPAGTAAEDDGSRVVRRKRDGGSR